VVTNTSRWEGWVPFMGQSPFFNGFNMDSYVDLKPKTAADAGSGGARAAIWIAAGLVAAAVVVIVLAVVLRRRHREGPVEEA